jgi:hypothetical protein
MYVGSERLLREGDIVTLRTGAPIPTQRKLQPGALGRVVIADAPTEADPMGEVSVMFGKNGTPLRLHRHWLRLVRRPKGRGRAWQAPPKG